MLPVLHSKQRYDTVGDYQDAHGVTLFTISMMEDGRYESLVALHEFIEKTLVDLRRIPDQKIDDFDMAWVDHDDIGEPGHDPAAPYHKEHVFAEKIERLVAKEMGVDWDEYERVVMSL